MKNATDNSFKTSDLWVSIYLRASGFPIIGVERTKRKVTFCFPGDAEQTLPDYFNDVARLPILTVRSAFQQLKTIIFAGEGASNGEH